MTIEMRKTEKSIKDSRSGCVSGSAATAAIVFAVCQANDHGFGGLGGFSALAAGQVRVLHVPSRYQFADIFTKGLPSALFEEFRTSLSVRCPPAPTAGE
ncbi:hypothetical protein Tco_1345855, partial [Tanacetum coccineum]